MESPSILIDTSVLIDYFRKKNKENSLLYKISLKHSLAVSTITEFEFFVGLSEKHLEFTSRLFETFLVLPFDSKCAKIASGIYKELKSKNKLISPSDIFIAATAMSHDLRLVTFNSKHFERIHNLKQMKIE